MSERNGAAVSESDDTLLVAGVALISIGAGIVMAHPGIRKQVSSMLTGAVPELGEVLSGQGVGGITQDLQRYMKLRSM